MLEPANRKSVFFGGNEVAAVSHVILRLILGGLVVYGSARNVDACDVFQRIVRVIYVLVELREFAAVICNVPLFVNYGFAALGQSDSELRVADRVGFGFRKSVHGADSESDEKCCCQNSKQPC